MIRNLNNVTRKLGDVFWYSVTIPKLILKYLLSTKEDKQNSISFKDETKVKLSEMYEIIRKATTRHLFKTKAICTTIEITTKKGFVEYNKDIYKTIITNDKTCNCTWLWIEYHHMFDLDFEKIIGPEYVTGYLYKLPYINKKSMDSKNNSIINNKLEEIIESKKIIKFERERLKEETA